MNLTTTFDAAAFSRPLATGLNSLATIARRGVQQIARAPLLLWSLVLAAGLLAFFVHLLNAQVLRGEQLREQQRAGAHRPAGRLLISGAQDVAQHPGNALIASRQPMTRP